MWLLNNVLYYSSNCTSLNNTLTCSVILRFDSGLYGNVGVFQLPLAVVCCNDVSVTSRWEYLGIPLLERFEDYYYFSRST